MNKEDLIFEQYRLYSEQKEKFIDRSFMTNKFYMIVVLGLLLLTFATKGMCFGKLTSPSVFAIAGLISCALWWLNMDSYNLLIKIKFSKVLEEIEKELPKQPYAMEYKGIKDFRKNKKMFLFSDMQKIYAVFAFLVFFIMLMIEIIPLFIEF